MKKLAILLSMCLLLSGCASKEVRLIKKAYPYLDYIRTEELDQYDPIAGERVYIFNDTRFNMEYRCFIAEKDVFGWKLHKKGEPVC